MATFDIFENLYTFIVDEQEAPPVLEFLAKNKLMEHVVSSPFYGRYTVIFKKGKDDAIAIEFKLKFSDIVQETKWSLMVSDANANQPDE